MWTRARKRLWVEGFTLLEVMVSVGILGVIMVLVWSSTAQTIRSKDRVEERDLMFHSGQVALKKIADDVEVAFLATTAAATTTTASAETTAQAPPTANFKTFFIGEDRGDQDALKFTSLSHLRLVASSKESDQCRISYEIVPHPEEPGFFNLVRREQPWLDKTTDVEGRTFALVEKIVKFNVEYYDELKNDWGKEWDTDKLDWKDRLPMAVRIKIVFADPNDETQEIPLSTAVMPAMWKNPISL
ncbi:MAG: type II secretion system protein GspJ [Pseudomonadota bacterium]